MRAGAHTWRFAALATAATAAAIATVFACVGTDPGPSVTPDDGGAATQDAPAVVVVDDAGHACTCLPEVPAGWDGPFVLDEIADCTAPWNEARTELYADLDAGAHVCTCACSAAAPQCRWRAWYEGSCTNRCSSNDFVLSTGAPAQNCFAAADTCDQNVLVVVDGGGPCTPDAGKIVDRPGWTKSARRCDGPAPRGVCPDPAQPCAPSVPPTGAHCIAQTGDVACPPSYGKRSVYYSRFEDTRDCTSCGCGETGKPCDVGWYPDTTCNEAQRIATASTTICTPRPANATAARLVRAERSCAADGGAPTGAATPRDPITFCCRVP